jgi:hypothetical protein
LKVLSYLKVLGAGALLAAASLANGTPVLRISDGSTTLTIQDGQGGACGDMNGLNGVVQSSCSLSGWIVNTAIGVDHTNLGNATHLTSIDVSSASGGSLSIMLTDTGYDADGLDQLLNVLGQIGGVAGGTLSYALYVADSNNQFDLATLIGSGSTTGGAFGSSFSSYAPLSGLFSMTLVANLTHAPGNFMQATSFDFQGTVPEPGTLSLLGLSLAGVGLLARRRRKQ